MLDALIVGAGLAGLSAANKLQANGLRVLLVEEEREVGGRLSTRPLGNGRADQGAQFFTVRMPEFRAIVDQWMVDGLVFEWARGWSDGSLAVAADDGHPRYAATGGFSQLARHLAAELDVRLNTLVTAVEQEASGWRVVDQAGQSYQASAVILTPPVPQSLALLEAGGVRLAADDRWALASIAYAPCLCGLFWVTGGVNLPEPGGVQRPEAAVSWIADNQRKGISPETQIITVHANERLSRELWDAETAIVLARLQASLEAFLDEAAVIREAQLKRWRYATPTTIYPQRCLVAQDLPPLIFAGDAFAGPRVEGAVLSGWSAAAQVLIYISRTII